MKSRSVIIVMLLLATAMSASPGLWAGETPTAGVSITHEPEAKDEGKEKKAHLELDSLQLDLGKIEMDSIGIGVMHFRNTGDAPLVIHRVFSECGCTVPSYSDRPIAPGKTGSVKVRFKTKGHPLGFFRKTLRIKSNADNERMSFSVKGHVVKKL